jgi:hypothetical protein
MFSTTRLTRERVQIRRGLLRLASLIERSAMRWKRGVLALHGLPNAFSRYVVTTAYFTE